jgi:uncharacterized metal-binding protein
MAKAKRPLCSKCTVKACEPAIKADEKPTFDKAPDFCPMVNMSNAIQRAVAEYDKPDVREFARLASLQEFECYEDTPEGKRTRNPRILELIEFCDKCDYKKIGLAFCAGLYQEARVLTEILENKGLEVTAVRCKVGATPKEKIGIKPAQKIFGADNWETMCNPIAQAELINAAGVDFAVMLGLCIGHDTLFIKYCRVPMTVIAVKDRVTGHNPLAALYTVHTYYKRLASKRGVKSATS